MTTLSEKEKGKVDQLKADVKALSDQRAQILQAKEYIAKNRKTLLKKYRDRWIAVSGEGILLDEGDLRELVTRLKKIDRQTVVIEYLTDKQPSMLLYMQPCNCWGI